jgi:N4-gp56 family major capsid protein
VAGYPKTTFVTSDNLTRKKWARELFSVLLPATEFNDLIGKDTNAIIQMRTELAKGEGDVIKFGIRLPLSGTGVQGNDPVEGNEEKLIFKDFSVTIEELNHAVDTGGKMEEQRIPYNLIQEGKNGLQDWWAAKLSDYAFAVLCGDTSFNMVAGKGDFGTAIAASDTNHVLRVNDAATDAAMTSADVMDLTFLDRMKQLAEMPTGTNCYKVRPLVIGGKKYFRIILHTYCFDALRQNTNVGQWGDLLRSANKLAQPNVEIEYNGMLVSKSERIRKSPTNSSVYRNLLLGAQAAVFAWGGAGDSKSTTMAFVPYQKDANRFMMVRGGGIFGMAKTTFASKDYGIITGCAYGSVLA